MIQTIIQYFPFMVSGLMITIELMLVSLACSIIPGNYLYYLQCYRTILFKSSD